VDALGLEHEQFVEDVGLHSARVMVRYLQRSGIPKVSSTHV